MLSDVTVLLQYCTLCFVLKMKFSLALICFYLWIGNVSCLKIIWKVYSERDCWMESKINQMKNRIVWLSFISINSSSGIATRQNINFTWMSHSLYDDCLNTNKNLFHFCSSFFFFAKEARRESSQVKPVDWYSYLFKVTSKKFFFSQNHISLLLLYIW